MIDNLNAIILAAGKGTRMNQPIPKCACNVLGKPMIMHLVNTLKESGITKIIIVVGFQKEIIMDILKDEKVEFVEQTEQLGTAHACQMAYEKLNNDSGNTLIIPGDMPLIGKTNIELLVNHHLKNNSTMTILSSIFENPFSYGRIIRNHNQNVIGIIEEKEATNEQKLIKEINTGLYIVDNKLLFESLFKVDNHNEKNEYYLTDIVKILSKNHHVCSLCIDFDYRLMGINDVKTLEKIEILAMEAGFNG